MRRNQLWGGTVTLLSALWLASCGGSADVETKNADVLPAAASKADWTGWKRWSDRKTWGGTKPVAGSSVNIPAGTKILLDESPPALADLTIHGELAFEDRTEALELSAHYIVVQGALQAGSAAEPYRGRATITLTAADDTQNIDGMGTRGIFVHDGARLELVGTPPSTLWTRITDHVDKNATVLKVMAAQGWKAGDQLVIAPTEYYGFSQTQALTVAGANDSQVSLSTPVQQPRWGRMQYVTRTGMALQPEAGFQPNSDTPIEFDGRAAVGHLSRNIVVQGADDAVWKSKGFGAQVMVMGSSSITRMDGVELRRVGQKERMGRYPIHFHLLGNYDSSGKPVPQGGERLVRRSAIWNSANRCITVHGTNFTTLSDNVCYDIVGHAIFLEDAVERKNTLTRNLVLKVRAPGNPFLRGDDEASGFWITHPDNTVTDNYAADTSGMGYWLSFPPKPIGVHSHINVSPRNGQLGAFDRNTSHSNLFDGIHIDNVLVLNSDFHPKKGEVDRYSLTSSTYAPTLNERPEADFDYTQLTTFAMNSNVTSKNFRGGLWNRVAGARYARWVASDNVGRFFAGGGLEANTSAISNSLVIGESLNNQRSRWVDTTDYAKTPPTAFATYHSQFNIANNTIVQFPLYPLSQTSDDGVVEYHDSGTFSSGDYYLRGVERGTIFNPDNQLIASAPGWRMPPPVSIPTQVRHWTLSGAVWDPHGYFGPAKNYWTYDKPFLTHGATCQPVAPVGQNGMSCNAEYFGVGEFSIDGTEAYLPTMPLHVTRQDSNGAAIDTWSVESGTYVNDEGKVQVYMLGNMRHFAAMRGGRYRIEYPNTALPQQRSELTVTNLFRQKDEVLLGIPYAASSPVARAHITRFGKATRNLAAARSLEEVRAGDGGLYWRDGNTVWIKVVTPDGSPWDGYKPLSLTNLYRPLLVSVAAAP